MRLSEDIFSYGMWQLPVATSSIVPPEPFRSWGKRATQLEAENERLELEVNYMEITIGELRKRIDALKESNND